MVGNWDYRSLAPDGPISFTGPIRVGDLFSEAHYVTDPFMYRPFRALSLLFTASPGRCPGLVCHALSGLSPDKLNVEYSPQLIKAV